MSFDLEKAMANGGRCQTRGGYQARIICSDRIDRCDERSIVALVLEDNSEHAYFYYSSGRYAPFPDHSHDLVNIPVKRGGWINIRPYHPRWSAGTVYATQNEADAADAGQRIACVRVEWEE